MLQLGDYAEDATLDFKFPTHQADGTPITLAGSPAVSVYKGNGTTESTAGVTLTVDFDSLTGMHHVRVDLSADAFYAVTNDYQVVITAGTVDGISVVGTPIAHFSIENRASVTAGDPWLTALPGAYGAGTAGKIIGDNINATISSRATPAQVNAEVLDVLNVDTFAEPGQEAPGATISLAKKIGFLYKNWRNRQTSSSTEIRLYNDDATTIDQKWEHSDNGATYDKGEAQTGP